MRPFGAALFLSAPANGSRGVRAEEEKMQRHTGVESSPDGGVSSVEILITTVVTGILLLIGIPVADDAMRSAALKGATAKVHALLVRCRAVAVLRSRNCSVVFDLESDGSWRCIVAEDGDGDGVRRSDIRNGVDPVIGRPLLLEAGAAGPGILAGPIPDPSGQGNLGGDPADPIRAGQGNMVSFSPRGTATPSSVFLTDGVRRMEVLRVYGGTGRINRLRWHRGLDGWRR
jgi:hypothetical protein